MAGSPSSDGSAQRFPTEESRSNPIPDSSSPVQSHAGATDEEDIPSMRELVRTIDTHVDTINLKVTNNLNAVEGVQVQQSPTKDVPDQQANDAVHLSPTNPSV